MLKKIFIGLAVFFILTLAGIYFLTRPSVLAKIVQSAVNTRAANLKLTEFTFKSSRISSNGFVTIKDIRFAAILAEEKQKCRGEIPYLYLDNVKSFLSQKKITVSFSEAHLKADNMEFKRIALKAPLTFLGGKWRITDGNVSENKILDQKKTKHITFVYFTSINLINRI